MMDTKNKDIMGWILVAAVVGLILFQVAWSRNISATLTELQAEREFNRAATVFSMPLSFLTNETECANKLLQTLGYDDIHIQQSH